MRIDPTTLAVILAMAAITLLTRLGGYWLAGRVADPERLARWLRHAPAAILAAIVVPAAVDAGWLGLAGLLVVLAAMRRGGNVLVAMAAGVAVVAFGRALT